MSLLPTRQDHIFAREGWLTILFALLLFVAGWSWHVAAGTLATIWLVFCLNFFRNPKRQTPPNPNALLCPADGKVIVIDTALEPEFLHREMQRISVFMSPLNVHVNRAPCDGTVQQVTHRDGKFLAAFDNNASTQNERSITHVKNPAGDDIVFVQIAGWLARRIINYLRPTDKTAQGKIFGLIKFGSRMDIYFPVNYKILVTLNQKVKAGQTWLAAK